MNNIKNFKFTEKQKDRYKEIIEEAQKKYPFLFKDEVDSERMAVITADYIINKEGKEDELVLNEINEINEINEVI
jgi:hypothetical protein